MKLNKSVKKALAYACSVVLVVGIMTGYQKNVQGTIPEDMTVIDNTKDLHKPEGTAWQLYFGGAGGPVASGGFKGGTSLEDPFTLYVEQTSGAEWGIQAVTPQISGLKAFVTYQYSVTFTSSKAGTFYTKENYSNSKKVMQEYTEGENTVTGTFTPSGTGAVILFDMMEVESDTLFEFTDISVTDDFVEITTEAPTADAEGYEYTISEEWTNTTPWQAFAGGKNSMKFKSGTVDKNNIGLDMEILNSNGSDWSVQARILKEKAVFGPLVNQTTYDVEFSYTSSMSGSIVFQIAGNNNEPMQIEEGTHVITFEYASLETGYPNIYMNLAGLPTGTKFNFNAKFTEKQETSQSSPAETESSTEAKPVETESSTEAKPVETESSTESKPAESETPSVEKTTKPVASTEQKTDKPEITKQPESSSSAIGEEKTPDAGVAAPVKAKIVKVSVKKKSSKKIRMSLKKTSGAEGYQIAVYKTKKNAKQNKKALVKKFSKKTKVTVISKKLKNKKNLYLRVRAYALDKNKVKVYGKWSAIKRVKSK